MTTKTLTKSQAKDLLAAIRKMRVLVIGDALLDRYIWGRVSRISPEAPVPVVEYDHESSMPGGAGNVARNLTALGAVSELMAVIGRDEAGSQLRRLLAQNRIGNAHVRTVAGRNTSVKTRIIAHQQQVVRLDCETREDLDRRATEQLLKAIESKLPRTDAVIVGDYGKGVVTQHLLNEVKALCRKRGIWLSLDPKPTHHLDLSGLSLITPNRKEAFELAGQQDGSRHGVPTEDEELLAVANKLLAQFKPALLLVTLGEQGMLLCRQGKPVFHVPTVAKAVFDVSGAGDTVISSFTLAVAAGASPEDAAVFSNHAAGVVVGKFGTATVSPEELLASFADSKSGMNGTGSVHLANHRYDSVAEVNSQGRVLGRTTRM